MKLNSSSSHYDCCGRPVALLLTSTKLDPTKVKPRKQPSALTQTKRLNFIYAAVFRNCVSFCDSQNVVTRKIISGGSNGGCARRYTVAACTRKRKRPLANQGRGRRRANWEAMICTKRRSRTSCAGIRAAHAVQITRVNTAHARTPIDRESSGVFNWNFILHGAQISSFL